MELEVEALHVDVSKHRLYAFDCIEEMLERANALELNPVLKVEDWASLDADILADLDDSSAVEFGVRELASLTTHASLKPGLSAQEVDAVWACLTRQLRVAGSFFLPLPHSLRRRGLVFMAGYLDRHVCHKDESVDLVANLCWKIFEWEDILQGWCNTVLLWILSDGDELFFKKCRVLLNQLVECVCFCRTGQFLIMTATFTDSLLSFPAIGSEAILNFAAGGYCRVYCELMGLWHHTGPEVKYIYQQTGNGVNFSILG